MINLTMFTFNDFDVHTYVLSDETNECVIIDPGCNNKEEEKTLTEFIEKNKLTPVKLLNTHCHIDHILGNKFVSEKYNISAEVHEAGINFLIDAVQYGAMFGLNVKQPPLPSKFIKEGDVIKFGNSQLDVIYTPGHADGSICFVNNKQKFIITGDVLFMGSIGRTDLPTGNYDILMENINKKLLTLGDDCKVFPGHGPTTSIGNEKQNNPFLNP